MSKKPSILRTNRLFARTGNANSAGDTAAGWVGSRRSVPRGDCHIALVTSCPETERGMPRPATRRRFPVRRLHLIDIENLADDPLPSIYQVRSARKLYADILTFGAMDQVVVASSHVTLVNAALGWSHARYLVRSGPDGAELALLEVLRDENIAERFTDVVIGSGDHLFASEAAHLAARGVRVTVVSRQHSLSAQLALAAREVIFLGTAAKAA